MTTALIVDDDQAILDLLEERLLSMGHECRKAQSQTEAEEVLNDHVFDYILLDLEIPNRFQGRADIVYGHNLLRKIRQTPGHTRTPVLAITAHGLKSHHLCAETMKLGATDFVGKPFGKDNPLEDKIREALRSSHLNEKDDERNGAQSKLTKFSGGDLVFYEDRVELCGIKVCGAKNSSMKRRVLDLLQERTAKGSYRCFPMKDIADVLKLERPGAVAEAVADFRKECRERLRDAGLACDDEDIVANQNRGYHLRDWIKVLDGLDEVEQAAAEKEIVLTDNQKGIIRLLRKHGRRSPRQLSDGLGLLRATIASEVDKLVTAGLVSVEGNGANKSFRLADA